MAYTTPLAVRKLLPGLLIGEDDMGVVSSGTTLTLESPAMDVITVEKNGLLLSEFSDFTFTRPRTITLDTAASGENFIATCYYGAHDSELDDIINRADRTINSYFGSVSLPSADYLNDWSSVLSASYYLKSFATANDENIQRANSLESIAMDAMQTYKDENQEEEEARTNYTYVVTAN